MFDPMLILTWDWYRKCRCECGNSWKEQHWRDDAVMSDIPAQGRSCSWKGHRQANCTAISRSAAAPSLPPSLLILPTLIRLSIQGQPHILICGGAGGKRGVVACGECIYQPWNYKQPQGSDAQSVTEASGWSHRTLSLNQIRPFI